MKAFTLIEAVLYLAIFSIMMSGAIFAAFQLVESSAATSGNVSVEQEGNFVMAKLDWALNGTSSLASIIEPSAQRPYSNEIVLTRADGESVAVRFNSASSSIEIEEGSSSAFLPLTSSNVSVEQLQFHFLVGSSTSVVVIEASTTINSENFYTKQYFK